MVFARVILGDSRSMVEIPDETIDLIITSPPYWTLKDYGIGVQIGFGQSLYEYFRDLYTVWKESYRVLKRGARLCINIADVYLSSRTYGKYKVVPLHAEVINQCEKIGFDFMGSIIWRKIVGIKGKYGMKYILGSYPYPPNGIVKIEYEYIMIFKKPGNKMAPSQEIKEASKLTKEEWINYFNSIWEIPGAKQVGHIAMFPKEIPYRLIKMFSFVDDVVLDPFLGSGTTMEAAIELGRNALGYEINSEYADIISEKVYRAMRKVDDIVKFRIIERKEAVKIRSPRDYRPCLRDIMPR